MMCDWIQSFIERFCMYKEIQTLQSDKFHGSLTLNFCDGFVQSYDLKLHRRAEAV